MAHTYSAVSGEVSVEWPKAGHKSYPNAGVTLVKLNADGKAVSVFGLASNATRDELASAGAAFRDAMLACAQRIRDIDAAPVTPATPAAPSEADVQARIDAAVKAAVAAALASAAPATPTAPATPAKAAAPKAAAAPAKPATPAPTGDEAIKSLPF